MPNKPTVPLYPPQGIQAELDLVYLCSKSALAGVTAAADEAKELAQKAIDTASGFDASIKDAAEKATAAEAAAKAAEEAATNVTDRVSQNASDIAGIKAQQTADKTAISELQTDVAENTSAVDSLKTSVGNIEEVIPTQASAENPLADKAFVNSTVQTGSANFRGNWPTYADIPSVATAYPVDFAGSTTPTPNDYLVVEADENYEGQTWRYKYIGNWATQGKSGWRAEYKVNNTPLTANQLAAINSGITADGVAQIATNKAEIDTKQDKLTAGENITIENNVISATGGGELPEGVLINQGGSNANSVTINPLNEPNYRATGANSIAIGYDASCGGYSSVRIGALGEAAGRYSIAIGHAATASAEGAIQLNGGTNETPNSLCVSGGQGNPNYMLLKDGLIPSERLAADGTAGQVLSKTDEGMEWIDVASGGGSIPDNVVINNTTSANGLAIGGAQASGGFGQIAIGSAANAGGNGGYGIAIGIGANTGNYTNTAYGIAIGNNATVMARRAIQIGSGTNNVANTLNIGLQAGVNYTLLTQDGTIPSARFANGGTDGQVLVKNGETAEWKDMGGGSGNGLPDQEGHSGYLTTDGITASWSDKVPLVNDSKIANSVVVAPSTAVTGQWSTIIQGTSVSSAAIYRGIAIGYASSVTTDSISIGYGAKTEVNGGIQLGRGTNTEGSTFCVGFMGTNYKLLAADGTIPAARLAADGTAGQVLSKTDDGMEWVDAASGGSGLPDQAGHTGYLQTDGANATWSDKEPLANTATATNGYVISSGTTGYTYNAGQIVIGYTTKKSEGDVQIGYNATTSYANSIAIGTNANASYGIAIGRDSVSSGGGVAIGRSAAAKAVGAVQIAGSSNSVALGNVTNSEANTFKFANQNGNFTIIDADGHIPDERLPQLGNINEALATILGTEV